MTTPLRGEIDSYRDPETQSTGRDWTDVEERFATNWSNDR